MTVLDKHELEIQRINFLDNYEPIVITNTYDAIEGLKSLMLGGFVGVNQLTTMTDVLESEECECMYGVIANLVNTIATMPQTYESDERGMNAIVYLHYFNEGMDWFITEKDMLAEQRQAFGYADFHDENAEFGYISISDIVENNVEIDLYWKPKTLKEVIK